MLISLLVIGVLFIVTCVALFKSTSTWNWVPIVSVLFIFVAAVFAGVISSQTLKTRSAWMQKDKDNQQLAAAALTERDQSLYGPANAIEYAAESLVGTNNELNLLTIGEGRIWRSGQPVAQGEQVTLTFAPVDSGGVARPSPATQLVQDMQLYAFADRGATINDVLVPLPVQYVGTFLVQSVANDSVTLKPLFVTEYSTGEATAPTTTWSLFETMPGDSPTVYRDDLEMQEFDITAFRTALRDQYLPAESLGLDPASKEYETLLDEYTFDGLSMNVIQQWIDSQPGRINDRFDPDSANKNVMIRFNDTSPPLSVDGTGNPVTDAVFDQEGMANDPNLQLGSDVTLRKDEEILVPFEAFEQGILQADGTRDTPLKEKWPAESIVEHYARPLRDYPFALRELGDKARRMQESLDAMISDIEISQAMIDNTNNQIEFRGQLIVKLQSDISRRQQELAQISSHREQLEQELARRQQEIRTYYEQILELYRTLQQPAPMQDTSTSPPNDSIVAQQR